ncbi:MAG: prepilin-type N-terminal cleavage/methylation domain-containing protein [Candidatus Babeliaceae bacterium]
MKKGFSLMELMIVITIIAFLAMIAIPGLMKVLARAKRTEALVNLRALYMAEKTFWAEHGNYTNILQGAGGLGWKPEGTLNYTYGFSNGSEGHSYFTGSLKTPASALQGSGVSEGGFTIAAAGDIDGDGKPDILTIDHTGAIKIVQDDLD